MISMISRKMLNRVTMHGPLYRNEQQNITAHHDVALLHASVRGPAFSSNFIVCYRDSMIFLVHADDVRKYFFYFFNGIGEMYE